jgi:hypothetical protein
LKNKPESGISVARIEQLVRDLGSPRYRVRSSATVKLGLIGEPALPYIEKAVKSDDLEVARRAERLRTQITRAAAQRREELLAKIVPKHVKPAFVFVPKAETCAGHRVHIVRVKLQGLDKAAVPQFRQLFGPEWDHVRLAVHGKQVVVLVGSDLQLLQSALRNLQEGKTGLAASRPLAGFHKQSNPERKVEFHVSVQKVLALITAPKDNRPPPAKGDKSMTSFALTVEPNRLQLDIWVPTAEVKAVVKKRGWW